MHAAGPGRRPRRRNVTASVGGLAVGGLVVVIAVFATITPAAAAVQGFTVSPTSGPGGTVVDVRGTGCAPGITLIPGQDYVQVSSTTLALSTNIAVAANGSWHGSFTVPANALAVPGLVTAICFSNGLPSLTTIYTPATFVVTGAPPATTPPTNPTTTTNPPPTATTQPRTTPTTTHRGSGPPTTKPPGAATPGSPSRGGPTSGSPTPGAGPGGGANGGNGGSAHPPSARGGTGAAALRARPDPATAAGLDDPVLTSSTSDHHRGIAPWVFWLLLVLLVAGAAVLLRWWQHREPGEPAPIEVAPIEAVSGEA